MWASGDLSGGADGPQHQAPELPRSKPRRTRGQLGVSQNNPLTNMLRGSSPGKRLTRFLEGLWGYDPSGARGGSQGSGGFREQGGNTSRSPLEATVPPEPEQARRYSKFLKIPRDTEGRYRAIRWGDSPGFRGIQGPSNPKDNSLGDSMGCSLQRCSVSP